MSEAVQHFAAALSALDAALDWGLLGDRYCHEGGEAFFPLEQRAAIADAGLHLAGELGAALERLPAGGPGASLYLGAALGELAPILFETLVAGRAVVWRNQPGAETDELNRALAVVAQELDLVLPRVETGDGPYGGPYDHLWCVSVLTDPETFPTLHDELYGRRGTELAAGGGDRRRERRRAERLVESAVATLAPRAVLTTSDEELPFFQAACAVRRLALDVPRHGRTSAIVGDVVRCCRVRPA